MANLTVVIDDDLLHLARIKALQEGTSVNAICREAIERYAGRPQDHADKLIAAFREIGRHTKAPPPGEQAWPGRQALYDDILRDRCRMAPSADGGGTEPAPPPVAKARKR